MKKLLLILGSLWLVAATVPVSASDSGKHNWSKARIAEKLQRHLSYLPRLYQTSNVVDYVGGQPGVRKGAAWLVRSANGVEGRIMAKVPTAGDPYTLWIIVFNNPSACAGTPCGDPDLANPKVRASIFNGTGMISGSDGQGGGVFNADFSILAGKLPKDLFILIGEDSGLRRNRGYKAQIGLVIDRHLPITPGMDPWIADLTETNFPGAGTASNDALAVFLPCSRKACPESIL